MRGAHCRKLTNLEVTLFGTMIGGPQIYDVISQMKEYGFVVYDFYGFLYRPLDGALAQVDAVFVREDGKFRTSHAFSTPEKRRQAVSQAGEHFETMRRSAKVKSVISKRFKPGEAPF